MSMVWKSSCLAGEVTLPVSLLFLLSPLSPSLLLLSFPSPSLLLLLLSLFLLLSFPSPSLLLSSSSSPLSISLSYRLVDGDAVERDGNEGRTGR